MTLGEKIAELRTDHHLSQADLAEKMGVSRQSVSKWETGNSVPDLDKIVILSELFHISLDTLVKGQQTIVNPEDKPSILERQASNGYHALKIAGLIFLITGLLSVVLGIALNLILAVLGGYLLICGIICLTVKKHPGLVIGWGTFIPCAYLLPMYTSANMKMIFHSYAYCGDWGVPLMVSYTFWAVLFLLLFLTVKNTRMKNYPFLFCGWMIFSQLYGFISIAFFHAEEASGYYLVISWCVILFLVVLVFFTGKRLYAHFGKRQ